MRFSTWAIAWRNLGRHRRRTLLALLAIGVGQFALLATNGLFHGYADNIRRAITGPMIGHAQVHHPDWREERALDLTVREVAAKTAAIARDSAVTAAGARIYAPVLVAPERQAWTAMVVGVQFAVEARPYGMLSGFEGEMGDHEVLLGYRLARRIGVTEGAEIAVVGQSADGFIANDLYTVRAIVRSPADLVNETGIVMPLAAAQTLLGLDDQAHEIVVRAPPGTDAGPLTDRLAALPALADLDVRSWRELMPELVMMLEMSNIGGYIVLVLVMAAAVAGIANTLLMSTFERMHEFGMLLALGCGPGRLVRMILAEAVLLGALGVAVGTVGGVVFVWLTAGPGIDLAAWTETGALSELSYQGLQLPVRIHPRLQAADALVGLAAVLVTALFAALWPAWIAARLEPMEAMHR